MINVVLHLSVPEYRAMYTNGSKPGLGQPWILLFWVHWLWLFSPGADEAKPRLSA